MQNRNQVVLPIDVEILIEKNDLVRKLVEICDELDNRVYLEGYAWNERYNAPRPFKRLVASYADLLSAVCEMHRYISLNNEEGR